MQGGWFKVLLPQRVGPWPQNWKKKLFGIKVEAKKKNTLLFTGRVSYMGGCVCHQSSPQPPQWETDREHQGFPPEWCSEWCSDVLDTQDDAVIFPTVHNIFYENMFHNIEKIFNNYSAFWGGSFLWINIYFFSTWENLVFPVCTPGCINIVGVFKCKFIPFCKLAPHIWCMRGNI